VIKSKISPFWILYILIPLVSILGCTHLFYRYAPRSDIDATILFDSISAQNHSIQSFKGIGSLWVYYSKRIEVYRVAWAGTSTRRLRIEIIGHFGQPIMVMIIKGSKFLLLNRNTNQRFKGDATTTNMKRFLSISMPPDDLFMLLSGRTPLAQPKDPCLRFQKSESEVMLTITEKWGHVLERIWLHDKEKIVKRVEMYRPRGGLRYRVIFDNIKKVENFKIPHTITISTPDYKMFKMKIRRLWLNIPINEETFILKG